MQLLAAFVFITGGLMLALTTIQSDVTGGDDSIARRLKQLRQESQPQMPEWARAIAEEEKKNRKDLKDVFTKAGLSVGYWESLEKQLAQAEMPMKPGEWLILRFGLLIALPAIGFVAAGGNPLGAGLAFLFAVIAPGYYLSFCASGRVNKFNLQLADFLVLVVNGLRAGQTFLQGVDHAVRECPDPLASEFRILLNETNLGMPIDVAFDNLVRRVPSQDLEITATAFIIQKNVGGNLAEVMEKVAATIRERVKLQGQIRVLTSQGMLSGFLVGGLPVALLIGLYMMNPSYIGLLFTTTQGNWMLAFGAFLELLGAYTIKQIITIDI